MEPATYVRQLARAADTVSPQLATALYTLSVERLLEHPHGDMTAWQQALSALPDIEVRLDAGADTVCLHARIDVADKTALTQTLMRLHPWRKGPFNILGVTIDCE